MTDLSKLATVLSGIADSITKVTKFMEQVKFNSLFTSKLDFFTELIERIKCLQTETITLKTCLANEVKVLKCSHPVLKSAKRTEIIIPGISSTITEYYTERNGSYLI